MAALETEATDYVERHRHERDAAGRALVVPQRPEPRAQTDLGRGDGGATRAAGQ